MSFESVVRSSLFYEIAGIAVGEAIMQTFALFIKEQVRISDVDILFY